MTSRRFDLAAIVLMCVSLTATAGESYSILEVPLPTGVTLTADDELVPQWINDSGSHLLFSLRNHSTGAVTWYTYGLLNGGDGTPTPLPSSLSGYQHVHFNGIHSSFASVYGWAWNTDADGMITTRVPIRVVSSSDSITVFGSLQGRFICSNGPNIYGQVFSTPPSHAPSAIGRAGFWIPTTGITTPGYPLNNTALKDHTAIIESAAKREFNGDYIAGSHTTASGFAGFWRYLRPVGDPATFELVTPPASLDNTYTESTAVSWANAGVTSTGEALYRIGMEDDSAVPMVSFLSVAGSTTIIQPPSDVARNVMRAHDLAKYGNTITAIGFAKQRTGDSLSGSDSNQTAWIWHQGEAQATRLQSLIPKPAVQRIGSNAAAISLGIDAHDGGQILIDGWDPDTTTTTPADKRILVLSRIPTLTQTSNTTTIQEHPVTTAAIRWAADATTTLYRPLIVTYVLGGTANQGVDYTVSGSEYDSIISQTGNTLVVADGGINITPINNATGGPDKTVTVTLDASASGYTPATAYKVTGPATVTITIINDDVGPTTTLSRTGSGPVNGPITLQAQFNAPVTGLIAADITADAGTVSSLTGSGSTYGATWTPPVASVGTATLRIPTDAAHAVTGGLGNQPSNDLTIVYDTRPPTVVVSTLDSLPTPNPYANLLVTFADGPISGIADDDFDVVGGSIAPGSLFIDPYGYMFQVRVNLVAEHTTVQFKAGTVQDQAANTNSASNILTITRYLDPLTVTLNQAPDQPDPAWEEPVRYLAVFNKPVLDFTSFDVLKEGTAFPFMSTLVVSNPSGDNQTFLIELANLGSFPALLNLGIPSHIASHAGLPNATATSTDKTVSWDPSAVPGPGSGGGSGGSGSGSNSSCGLGSGIASLLLVAFAAGVMCFYWRHPSVRRS